MPKDENPYCLWCSDGPSTWWFYKWAVSIGKIPENHKDNIATPLSYKVSSAPCPVYKECQTLISKECNTQG